MKKASKRQHDQDRRTMCSVQMAQICELEHQVVFDDIRFMLSMFGIKPLRYHQLDRDESGKECIIYDLPLWLAMEWAAGYDRSRSEPLIRHLLMQDKSLYAPMLLTLMDEVADLKEELKPLSDQLKQLITCLQ